MTKFKVGDKVRFIEDYMDYKKGDIVEVEGFWSEGINYFGKGNSTGCYFSRVELVETKPTKNQRITALENEVAELKLIVHELRERPQLTTVVNNAPQGPSTTDTVEDIIEFEGAKYRKVDREAREGDVVVLNDVGDSHYFETNKPYKVQRDTYINGVRKFSGHKEAHPVYVKQHNRTPETVDVYEVIKDGLNPKISMVDETIKPLTPNQQRAAIIEKAKKFVKENKNKIHPGNDERTTIRFIGIITDKLEFVINEEKRTVVALIKGVSSGDLYAKGIAKCNPSDVFNEHIGKAIALGRALGLDVSEFEQAVQPTEFATGQIFEAKLTETHIEKIIDITGDKGFVESGGFYWTNRIHEDDFRIINDTNAKYEVSSNE